MGERAKELLTLLLGDIAIFVTALWLTLAIRYFEIPSAERLELHLGPFLLLSGVWLLVFYVAGMYDKHTSLFRAHIVSQIVHTQFINVLIAAVAFMVLPLGIAPKTNLIFYLIISIILITVWRVYLFPRMTPRHTRRAILIADGDEAIELVDEVNNNPRYNYNFLRIIDQQTANSTPNFNQKLLELIDRERIEVIVADPHSPYIERVLPELFRMSFERFQITFLDFYSVYESTFDRVPLSALRYDWFLTHVSQSRNLLYDTVKRSLDIVGSVILGIVFLLLLPGIALAVRLEGKGELFITQERLGQYNRRIKVYKLRTMTVNQTASSTWTTEDTKRGNTITRVGAVLRKTSLDEVPQVWNILKGEMSLIGPRNDILGLAERLAQEISYYSIRNFVKPGVSGWAQTHQHYMGDNISPQSLEETRVRLAYDLYYVKNKSLLLDLEITLRTFKTLLSRFGVTVRWSRKS